MCPLSHGGSTPDSESVDGVEALDGVAGGPPDLVADRCVEMVVSLLDGRSRRAAQGEWLYAAGG
jgi:hypothetical protein